MRGIARLKLDGRHSQHARRKSASNRPIARCLKPVFPGRILRVAASFVAAYTTADDDPSKTTLRYTSGVPFTNAIETYDAGGPAPRGTLVVNHDARTIDFEPEN